MIKVKGVSEHKKNAVSIYTKKFSHSTPKDESKHNHKTSNINNINNITINLREKSNLPILSLTQNLIDILISVRQSTMKIRTRKS